jgi:dienelactone hydrolase
MKNIVQEPHQFGASSVMLDTQSKNGSGIEIVIVPGGKGLWPAHTELADRFATAGIQAIAIRHFGRTAGLDMRREGFDYAHHRDVEEFTGVVRVKKITRGRRRK